MKSQKDNIHHHRINKKLADYSLDSRKHARKVPFGELFVADSPRSP